MSNPGIVGNDLLDNIDNELRSALSSLNMEPELLSEPLNNLGYSSSVDMWVAHAVEHINAATKLLRLIAGKNQLLGAANSGSKYTILLREIAIRHIITSQFISLSSKDLTDSLDGFAYI